MKTKQLYTPPFSEPLTVALKERMMLTLSVHSEETEIIGANENNIFEENEDYDPVGNNLLWSDNW